MTEPFVRRGDVVEVNLAVATRRALKGLPALIAAAGDAGGRLEYEAHPSDPEAEDRYRELVGSSLEESRAADRSLLLRGYALEEIGLDQAEAWMRVIGEARLVLAVRLGIEEDGWEGEVDPDAFDPDMALMLYLGYLQDRLVEALTE